MVVFAGVDVRNARRGRRARGKCATRAPLCCGCSLSVQSRVTDSAAPFCANPGSEWHPKAPKEDKTLDNGNPDIRIPLDLPVEEGEAPSRKEEKDDVGVGNPDIRVPDRVKSEEGL
ncbi:hypothetical protein NDU88_002267 [Pleurodeles waltl]|uniref:Uncharacterized protein n=1 Tax=Pleurodeles waltl TaxID=8319 RepID=A0AAV7NLI7_PLEWA|nr:hypothetical protein NDU88_002267 [Pleurodeles waltl]